MPRVGAIASRDSPLPRPEAPRQVRQTIIDFSSLPLPAEVSAALADAYWNHFGPRSTRAILWNWYQLKIFVRFVKTSHALKSLADVHGGLLAQYLAWLNIQCATNGTPWSKATKSSAYLALRRLLEWLAQCRPGLLAPIDFPINPFPMRNRSNQPRRRIPAQELREILIACEHDIAHLRVLRETADQQRAAARAAGVQDPTHSLGALLECIDQRFGGIVPTCKVLMSPDNEPIYRSIKAHGGIKSIEPYLYPGPESILPYYVAILIHSAGNPEAITALRSDCL